MRGTRTIDMLQIAKNAEDVLGRVDPVSALTTDELLAIVREENNFNAVLVFRARDELVRRAS